MTLRRYAEGTTVSVETTEADLKRLLRQYGADAIVVGWDGPVNTIGFRLHGRHVRYVIERPAKTEAMITHYPSGKSRPDWKQDEAVIAEERRRWRALLLIIRAKLELIAAGDATFDEEFLAHTMLTDGSTVGEWIAPQLADIYRSGAMPALVPGAQVALPERTAR